MRKITKKYVYNNTSVIDLFCGAGGLAHGFVKEGFNVVAGIDTDEDCRYPFEENNRARFIQKDVGDIKSSEIKSYFGNAKYRILAGCAPCQPFSTYYSRYSDKADERWILLNEFVRLIRLTKPDVITMENVPRLRAHPLFERVRRELKHFGYNLWHDVVYCPDYGIPQSRKRLVLLGSRLGDIELIPPTHAKDSYITVRDRISELPHIRAGDVAESDPLHRSKSLSVKNLKRIRASKPGGTWNDWDEELVAECHKADSGRSYGSVYGRMEWDKPSPTMTTQCTGFGNGRFGHPEQDRAISIREAALLQTFPLSYKFVAEDEQVRFMRLSKLIGNAVPVDLGRTIAKSIKKHIEVHNGRKTI